MWLLRKKNDDSTPKATRANLGEQNKMRYNKEKGRWEEEGKEDEADEAEKLAPPPMAKPKEEKPQDDNLGGPPTAPVPKKELTGVDALIAPPNPYANRLRKPPAAPPAPTMAAFGAPPTSDPAEGDGPGAGGNADGGAGEEQTQTGAPPSNPFAAATPAGAVAANPFAPRSRTGTQPFNPNAPRNVSGANPHAPRARQQQQKPQRPAARASPFAPVPGAAALAPELAGDPEGAGEEPAVKEKEEDTAASATPERPKRSPPALGESSEEPADGAPTSVPPSPFSSSMPAYSPFSSAAGRAAVPSTAKDDLPMESQTAAEDKVEPEKPAVEPEKPEVEPEKPAEEAVQDSPMSIMEAEAPPSTEGSGAPMLPDAALVDTVEPATSLQEEDPTPAPDAVVTEAPSKDKDDGGWGADLDFDEIDAEGTSAPAVGGADSAALEGSEAPPAAAVGKEPGMSNGESTSSWVVVTGETQPDSPPGDVNAKEEEKTEEPSAEVEEEVKGKESTEKEVVEEANALKEVDTKETDDGWGLMNLEIPTKPVDSPAVEEKKEQEAPATKEADDPWAALDSLDLEPKSQEAPAEAEEPEATAEEESKQEPTKMEEPESAAQQEMTEAAASPETPTLEDLFGVPAAVPKVAAPSLQEPAVPAPEPTAVVANGGGEREEPEALVPETPATPPAAESVPPMAAVGGSMEDLFTASASAVPCPSPAVHSTGPAEPPLQETPPAAPLDSTALADKLQASEAVVASQQAELAELRQRAAELERQLEEARRQAASREEGLAAAVSQESAQRESAEASLAEAQRQLEAERERSSVEREAAPPTAAGAVPRAGDGDEEFNLPDFLWSCNSEVMAYVQKIVGENARLRQEAANPAPANEALETPAAEAPSSTPEPFDPAAATPESASAFAEGVGQEDSHKISPLLALLQDHAEDLKVCSQVCAALEILTFTLPENREAIIQQGGVKAIMNMLERHQDAEAALLRPGMDVLWNLTFEEDAVDSAMEAGAIERIIALMRKHEGEAELLGAACAVLLNLAVREPNRWKIVQGGGVALVASAMQRHSQNEEVLELGCQALYMLAYHQDLKPLVLAAKGGDAAALAASCPRGAGRAQKWGRWLQEVLAC